jgi:hypothetical protein
MVCVECAISWEFIMGAPDGTHSDLGQVEAHFGLLGDSVNINAK